MNCKYCGKPADTIGVHSIPICIECLYENAEYAKYFNENHSDLIERITKKVIKQKSFLD